MAVSATGSNLPRLTRSSALRIAAPAAPRMVLCESTVNFQSVNTVQGRRRPTVTRHAASAIAIKAGAAGDRVAREQIQLAAPAAMGRCCKLERLELRPRGKNVLVRDGAAKFVAELDGDTLGVAVFHRDAVAVCADPCRERRDVVAVEMAQQFQRLGFHLFFFAADVRNHVAQDVHRGHAGIARARNRLHRGHKNLLDAEALFEKA